MSLTEELLAHTDPSELAKHLAAVCAIPANQQEISAFAIRLGIDPSRARLRRELLEILSQPNREIATETPELIALRGHVAALRSQLSKKLEAEPEKQHCTAEIRTLKSRRASLLAEKSRLQADLKNTP